MKFPNFFIVEGGNTMSWSDFEIPQFFIVECGKQCIHFNTGHVTNVTFPKIGSICGVFNQALENRPDVFYSTRGSKDNAITIC